MSAIATKTSHLIVGSRTDIGRVRKMNQDSFAILNGVDFDGHIDGLFIVADGMGGKAGGEIASRVTVETVPSVVMEALADEIETLSNSELGAILQEGLSSANEVVYTQSRANPELKSMGTTCVAALFTSGHAIIAHVGDSRIYLCRSSNMEQVTEDHSLVQEHIRSGELTVAEAKVSRYRNMITRAIGIGPTVAPEVRILELIAGDRLLLCSDGLTNMVDDTTISNIIEKATSPQAASDELVELALQNGGDDNVTVVIVQMDGERSVPHLPKSPVPIASVSEIHAMPVSYPQPIVRRSKVNMLLLFISVGLGIAASYMVRRDYKFVPDPPYLKHNEIKVAAPIPSPPKPDLTHLDYVDPVAMTSKALRGAPLACDGLGNLYGIALQSGAPVRVTRDGKVTLLVASETTPGVEEAGKHWAVDPQGNLYVSSRTDKTVNKYDTNGTRVGSFGLGKLKAPEAIAVDSSGNIYLVDGGQLMVMRTKTPQAAKSGAVNGPR